MGTVCASIVMHVENISEEKIPALEIPTGVPIIYAFDKDMNLIDKKFL
jgi:2,3-bisphosphoglycerate-dependent phosphoglycerate mutase